MLTTALQQSIKIPTDKYLGETEYICTCYGDSLDKNRHEDYQNHLNATGE